MRVIYEGGGRSRVDVGSCIPLGHIIVIGN